MIPKGDYLNLIPEYKTPYGAGYNELLYFDYIYDVVSYSMNDYPCGIIINSGDAMSVFSSLYDYEPPSRRFNHTNYFWKEDGKYEELTVPLFYVTKGSMPLQTHRVPKEFFNSDVHEYSNIIDAFKLKQDGFYNMIEGAIKSVDKIFNRDAMIKKNWHSNNFNDFKFQYVRTSEFYRIHFLDDKKVKQLFDTGDIYEFAEKYCFVYNEDNNLSYMLNQNFYDSLIEDYDCKIEPFIVDDESFTDFTPTMQFHAIFLRSHEDVNRLKKNSSIRLWKCIPFHSSKSQDRTNQFFVKNYNMRYKNTFGRDLCEFVVLDDHRFTKNEFGIGFDRLRNTKSLEESFKKKNLIWNFYESFMPESHKMIYDHTYGTDEKFFRRLKIHNYKDVDYITHVFINKYLLDIKEPKR